MVLIITKKGDHYYNKCNKIKSISDYVDQHCFQDGWDEKLIDFYHQEF